MGDDDWDDLPLLDEASQEQIDNICDEANQLMDSDRFPAAIHLFNTALSLIPNPSSDYEAALHVNAGIGDAFFYMGKFTEALDAFENAKKCPGGIGNPFIHFRLGQCYLELDNPDRAADELMRAYMGAGYDIFDDEDAKYLDFLKTRAELD